ncbi:hypothetical protein A584_24932, partial [Pseudomonas syringae pv. theae ICMP 3923]
WTSTLTLRIMRLNQGDQALPRYDLIHLNQEALATGLFIGEAR